MHLNRNYLNLVTKGVENYTIVQRGEYMEVKEGRDSRTLWLLLTFFFEKVCVFKHVQVKEQGYLGNYYRVMVKGMGCACIVKNQIGVPAY